MYFGAHWTKIGHPVIQFGKPDLLSFLFASKSDSRFFKSRKLITVCMDLPHNWLTGSSIRKAKFVKQYFASKPASRLIKPVSWISSWHSSLWMRCEHSLCGKLSFSSSSSFMDSTFIFSTLAFHICILLYHHHPHHLSSHLCLYLDTLTYYLLLYVLLFSTIWMVIMLLDYVFVLDDMDLFWLFVMDYMDFLMLMDIFELMCLYWDFDDW